MKVIAFDRTPDSTLDMPVGADIMPASAIIKDGKPFFIPALSENWDYYICPAFRVSRLGKNIGARFASRYIDAVTAAVITRPVDALDLWAGRDTALLNIYEGAVIIGDWHPLDILSADSQVMIGDTSVEAGDAFEQACTLLAATAAIGTIKIGDIMIPYRRRFARNLPLDTRLSGSIDSTPLLTVKIK